MHDRVKPYMDMLIRVDRFGRTYANYFVRGTVAGNQFVIVGGALNEIERRQRLQRTGAPPTFSRAIARAALIHMLEVMERTAEVLDITPSLAEDQFRAPWTDSDQELLAAARGFARDAVPLREAFLDFAMPETFIDDLHQMIADLTEAIAERNQGAGGQSSAVAMDDAMERALRAVRILNVVMENRYYYRDDLIGRLDWLRASFVVHWAWDKKKRSPVNAAPPSPTSPTPGDKS